MPTFTIFVFLLGFCSGCKSAAREKVENNCRVIQKPHTKTAARSSWNRVLATNRRSSCPVLQRRAHTHPASFAVSPGSSRRNVEMGSQSELPPHRHTPLHKGRSKCTGRSDTRALSLQLSETRNIALHKLHARLGIEGGAWVWCLGASLWTHCV